MFQFSITQQGIDKVLSKLKDLETQTMPRVARELHEWGMELTFVAEVLSPKDKLRGKDWRRRPKNQSFSASWQFDIELPDLDTAILDVGNVDERAAWIIDGTDPRPIPSKPNPFLGPFMYFYWENGYDGPGFYTDWIIISGSAMFGTPPHPVPEKTLESFNIEGHVAKLANLI